MRGRARAVLGLGCLAVISAVAAQLLIGFSAPATALSRSEIDGSGSSAAGNFVNVSVAEVAQTGLHVVYTPDGSAAGRRDFADGYTDYAVTDVPYQGTDPVTGDPDSTCVYGRTPQCRQYSYLPFAAGATTFPYHIDVAGQRVENLRLSGETLAKIFTGAITDWSDPEITADNNGRVLPALPIVPVLHRQGSAPSWQFSSYLAAEFPQLWSSFSGGFGPTQYYPTLPDAESVNGSDGVADFIASSAGNGAIGIDEYSYTLGKDLPVADVENAAGFYAAPTSDNVAIALSKATVNSDPTSANYLTEQLGAVYDNPDPRAYPLSSYAYAIIPTGPTPADARMTTAKRQTLADFVHYVICQGSALGNQIGYAPLPLNLVQAGLGQLGQLQVADSEVDLSADDLAHCTGNPTFDPANPGSDLLGSTAPQPAPCAQSGFGPCGESGSPAPSPSAPTAQPTASTPTPAPSTPAPSTPAPSTPPTGTPPPNRNAPIAAPAAVRALTLRSTPATTPHGTTVVLTGTAPPGSTVSVYFHGTGQRGYALRRRLLVDAAGSYRTSYLAVLDETYFLIDNRATLRVVRSTAISPTIAGGAIIDGATGQVVLTRGTAAADSVVILRLRPAGSAAATTEIRRVRVGANGVWTAPVLFDRDYVMSASTGRLRAHDVLLHAVGVARAS